MRQTLLASQKAAASSIALLLSSAAASAAPTAVTVNGWIRSHRQQAKVSFIDLNDGSDHTGLQAVISREVLNACEPETRDGLGTGASVSLRGELRKKRGGKDRDSLELSVDSVRLLGGCDGKTYPIQKKDHSQPFLRRNAHLRARTSTIASMLRIRDSMVRSCYDYYHQEGYINAAMPILTSSDCEGAGEVFTISHRPAAIPAKPDDKGKSREVPLSEASPPDHFFDRPTYLSVSGQLHLEALVVGGGLSRAWHLGPAFRAERSDTNRHLNEFWMLEAELAWTRPEEEGGRGLEDVMECVESCIMRIAADLAAHRKQELQDVFPKGWQVVESLLSAPSSGASAPSHRWKRIVYKDAIRELRDVYAHDREVFQHAPDYEEGLRSEHERWLADKYGPTFVTDYPASQKPFYMRVNGDAHSAGAAKTVACFDLLVPRIGELAGGSLREERLDVLEQAMRDKGMSLEEYSWYLDLRRYGSVGHGGFGLGWERLISWLTGLENVRECIAFPRGSEGSRF